MKYIITIILLISTVPVLAQGDYGGAIGRIVGSNASGASLSNRATRAINDKAAQDCQNILSAVKLGQNPFSALALMSEIPSQKYAAPISIVSQMFREKKQDDNILNACFRSTVNLRLQKEEEGRLAISVQVRNDYSTPGSETEHSSPSLVTKSACLLSVPAEQDCEIPASPAGQSVKEILSTFVQSTAGLPKTKRFSPADCDCANELFTTDRGGRSSTKMDMDKAALENKLNDFIIQSIGKKFVNDFAANLEDLNYYLNETNTVFKTSTNDPESGTKYQCNKEEAYRSKIQTACNNSSVTPAQQEERIKSLLTAWGKPAYTNFNEHLNNIGRDVLKIDPENGVGSSHKPVTREEFDAFRTSQFRRDPGTSFVDKIIPRILKDPDLNLEFKNLSRTRPVEEAFLQIIVDESVKPNSVVKTLLQDPFFDGSLFKEKMEKSISSGKVDDVRENVNVPFINAIKNNPGFKMFMSDKDKLNEVSLPSDAVSLTVFLESQYAGGFIDQKFHERCENLQRKFAEAVCTNPEKLIPQINPYHLAHLVEDAKSPLADDVNVFNKLLCERNGTTADLMENLDLDNLNIYSVSDYLGRLNKKQGEDAKDYLSYFARETRASAGPRSSGAAAGGASSLGQLMSQSAAERMSGHDGDSRPRISQISSNRIGSDMLRSGNGSNRTDNKTVSSVVVPENKSSVGTNSQSATTKDDVQSESTSLTNFTNRGPASIPGASTPSVTDRGLANYSNRDARSELRQSVMNDSNKSDVEKLISNIDDSSARELVSLREANLKSQQKILEISNQAEKEKLKALEQRIKDLQTARTVALKKSEAVADQDDEVVEERKPRKSKIEGRDVSSESGGFPNIPGQATFNTSGVNSGAANAGKSEVSAGRAGLVGASDSSSNANRPRFSNAGALIISSGTFVSQGQEIRQQELSNELAKFLNQSEPDISTLMNIKTSGMVYKFKVLENGQYIEREIMVDYNSLTSEVKSLIDQKIALRQSTQRSVASIDQELEFVKRTHSYLSLKLIIDQQTRR